MSVALTTEEVAANLAARTERRMEKKLRSASGYVPGAVAAAADVEVADVEVADVEVADVEVADAEVADAEVADADDTKQEMRALRAELDAMRKERDAAVGRVAPAQRDLDTYRSLALELQRALDEKSKQLDDFSKTKAAPKLEDFLDPEELEEIDPLVMNAMMKLAAGMNRNADVESEVQKVLQQREQAEIKEYREQALLSRDLSDIVQLKNDPRFIEWADQDDNDVESVVTMLLGASTKPAIDKYARLLKRKIDTFKESLKTPSQSRTASDARTALATGMRRKPNAAPSPAEAKALLTEARRLSRSRNEADRKKANDILTALGG